LFPNPNFIILDKGRNSLEKSVIVVENNKVIGYKFMDVSDPVTQVEFIKSGLSRIDYYPDQSDMVRGWLNKNKVKVINYQI
jgi:DNA polymerase-3 subunit epsilon